MLDAVCTGPYVCDRAIDPPQAFGIAPGGQDPAILQVVLKLCIKVNIIYIMGHMKAEAGAAVQGFVRSSVQQGYPQAVMDLPRRKEVLVDQT